MSDLRGRLFAKRYDYNTETKMFVPADMGGEMLWDSIKKDDKPVLLDVWQPRSAANHAHFFAILHTAWTHLHDHYHDEETLLDAVKIAVRHVRMVQQIDGRVIQLPKSIAFAAMGEEKFRRFKDRALIVLAGRLGVTVEQLVNEVKPLTARNRR